MSNFRSKFKKILLYTSAFTISVVLNYGPNSSFSALASDGKATRVDELIALNEAHTVLQAKLEQSRQIKDAKRALVFMKLQGKITNDLQKNALISFQNSIQIAEETRRVSVDNAILSFQSGLLSIVSQRKVDHEKILNLAIANLKTTRDGQISVANSLFNQTLQDQVSHLKKVFTQ